MSGPAILIVEDNEADVAFFREALEASGTRAGLHVVRDGQDAMKFLTRRPPHDRAPRPDVVVLDLNLPLKNGHEVVREMAADPGLRTIPVAILTTSTSETHVCQAYPGRCAYFVKTDEFDRLQHIIRQILHIAVKA
ncbi:MAG: response regulator [Phycisphaerae bacterium]